MDRKKVLGSLGKIVVWLFTAQLAYVFLVQGSAKFSATSGWARAFANWGYPDWFRMTVGVVEVLAGVLIVWPRSAPIGALLIMVTMLGAMSTHAFIEKKPREAFREVVPFTLATIVLVARRNELRRLLDRVSTARGSAPDR